MRLSDFQDGLVAALLPAPTPHAAAPAPAWLAALVAQPGFAVYRNTVLSACIDTLQANYPTVCCQVALRPAPVKVRHGWQVGQGRGRCELLQKTGKAGAIV
ncbi:MAG: hypothetical protein EOO29_31515, partial [Comamonadaceae bacterium]